MMLTSSLCQIELYLLDFLHLIHLVLPLLLLMMMIFLLLLHSINLQLLQGL